MVVISGGDGLADFFLLGLANGWHAIGEEEHNGKGARGGLLPDGRLQGIVVALLPVILLLAMGATALEVTLYFAISLPHTMVREAMPPLAEA